MSRSTGSLVGGIAGGVVGFFAGGNIMAGYAIGSMLGSAIAGPDTYKTSNEAPLISDFAVQTSSWGRVIPRIEGTVRLAGNLIYASDIETVINTETSVTEVGGKGGGDRQVTETETPEYFQTLAFGLSEGEVLGIGKMWADGELVINPDGAGTSDITLGTKTNVAEYFWDRNRATLDDVDEGGDSSFSPVSDINKYGLEYTLYPGSETQDVDPTIEAELIAAGKFNPAYRGTSHIVFYRFPLSKFNNRIPSMSFEIGAVTTATLTPNTWSDVSTNSPIQNQMTLDNDGLIAVFGDTIADSKYYVVQEANVSNQTYMEEYDVSTDTFSASYDVGNSTDIAKAVGELKKANNGQWFAIGEINAPGTMQPIEPIPGEYADAWEFAPRSGKGPFGAKYSEMSGGKLIATGGWLFRTFWASVTGSSGASSPKNIPSFNTYIYSPTLNKWSTGRILPNCRIRHVQLWHELTQTVLIIGGAEHNPKRPNNLMGSWGHNYFTSIKATLQDQINAAKAKYVFDDELGQDWYEADSSKSCLYSVGGVNSWKAMESFPVAMIDMSGAVLNDGRVLITGGRSQVGGNGIKDSYIGVFNGITVTWEQVADMPEGLYGHKLSRRLDGSVALFHKGSHIALFNPSSNTWLKQADQIAGRQIPDHSNDEFGMMPKDNNQLYRMSNINGTHKMQELIGSEVVSYADPTSVTLASVITNLCEDAGLVDGTDFDVTNIAAGSDTISGMIFGSVSATNTWLRQLMQVYLFDGIESEGIIKFQYRNQSSVVTIPVGDLGAQTSGTAESALMKIVRVQGIDLPRKTVINCASSEHDYAPYSTHTFSTNTYGDEQILNLPMVFTPTAAKERAELIQQSQYIERDIRQITLPIEYIKYDVGDIITIDSNEYRILFIEIGADFLLQVSIAPFNISQFTGTGNPGAGSGSGQGNPGAGGGSGDLDGGSTVWPEIVPAISIIESQLPVVGFGNAPYIFIAMSLGTDEAVPPQSIYYSPLLEDNFIPITTGGNHANAIFGKTLTDLPAGPLHVWDNLNTVSVIIESGKLSSLEESEVLRGRNIIQINGEIVQYKTATLTATRTYTLSGLLRGRYGTSAAMNSATISNGKNFVIYDGTDAHEIDTEDVLGHSAGSRTIGLTEELGIIKLNRDDVNRDYVFKILNPAGVFSNPFAIKCTGANLKPWEVWNKEYDIVGDDRLLKWNPTSRTNSMFNFQFDDDANGYEIDILSSAGVIVRTVVLNKETQEFTYTEAMTSADVTTGQTLTAEIYQMSSIVGRGYVSVLEFEAA